MKEEDKKKSEELYESYKAEFISEEDYNKAHKKSSNLGKQKDNFMLLLDMIKDYWNGNFPIPKASLAIIIGAIVYVVSPLDAIPDFIPIAGWLDDASIVAFAFNKLKSLIDDYRVFKYTDKY